MQTTTSPQQGRTSFAVGARLGPPRTERERAYLAVVRRLSRAIDEVAGPASWIRIVDISRDQWPAVRQALDAAQAVRTSAWQETEGA